MSGFGGPPQSRPGSGQAHHDRGARTDIRGGYARSDHRLAQNNHSNPQSSQQIPPGSYINPNFRFAPGYVGRDHDFTRGPEGYDQHRGTKRKVDQHLPSPSASWRGGHSSNRSHQAHPKKQPKPGPRLPQTPAAPSVPSFGAPFLQTLSTITQAKPLTSTSLGLVPSLTNEDPAAAPSSDSESEHSEADEEATLAALSGSASIGEGLRFEHGGEVFTLRNVADIRAWRHERAAAFPRRAVVQAKWEARLGRAQERSRIEAETQRAVYGVAEEDLVRATGEHERQNAQKAQRDDEAAADDSAAQAGNVLGLSAYASDSEDGSVPHNGVDADADTGAKDDDDDAPPDMASSKAPPTGHSVNIPTLRARLPCRYHIRSGSCKHGSRCHFEHARPELGWGLRPPPKQHQQHHSSHPQRGRDTRGTEPGTGPRPTLYQRLVQQEVEAENKAAVQAIKYLGDFGFFRQA